MRVAEAAAATLGHQHALTHFGQVRQLHKVARFRDRSGMHRRADGNRHVEVVAVAAVAVRALAVPAALGRELRVEAEVDEGVAVGIRDEVDRAAGAAVAAVRPAARHELLATEAERAAPAVPGLHVDVGFVNEHGDTKDTKPS